MNHRLTAFSSSRTLALAAAAVLTFTQLVAVDAIAQRRSVSEHAQIVQLERVVVTGQRVSALPRTDSVTLACVSTSRAPC